MPNISTFTAPALRIQPSEIGVEATAAAARRIGAFKNQEGESLTNVGARLGRAGAAAGDAAVDYETHREINAGSAGLMGVINSQTNAWNDTSKNADPNDPSVKDKFLKENLEPALEQFQSGFTTEKGQDWARQKTQALRQHMFEKTSADMSAMAADAVHMNVNKTVNLGINTVSNDPSSLDFVRDSVKSSIGDIADSSPNLTPQANAKVKQELGYNAEREIVHAAISGIIAKGGDWQKVANDPKNAPFVNRPELDTFAKAQKAQARLDQIQQKQLEIANRQDIEQRAAGDISKIWSDGVKYDDQGNPTIAPGTVKSLADVVRRYPNAPKDVLSEVEARINWVKSQQKEKKENVVTNPATRSDFLKRIDDDANPLTQSQIWQAEAEGKIKPQEAAIFRGWQSSAASSKELAPDRKDFLNRMSRSIDAGRAQGQATALGDLNMQKFEIELRRKEKELGAQARSLYDPNSPNYFGTKENLLKYHVTMQDSQKYDRELATEKPAGDTALRPVPSRAADMLRNNPSMRNDFDAKYGKGQAAKILGN